MVLPQTVWCRDYVYCIILYNEHVILYVSILYYIVYVMPQWHYMVRHVEEAVAVLSLHVPQQPPRVELSQECFEVMPFLPYREDGDRCATRLQASLQAYLQALEGGIPQSTRGWHNDLGGIRRHWATQYEVGPGGSSQVAVRVVLLESSTSGKIPVYYV